MYPLRTSKTVKLARTKIEKKRKKWRRLCNTVRREDDSDKKSVMKKLLQAQVKEVKNKHE